jgi:hypothetical protein
MKKTLTCLTLLISINGFSQFSNYYNVDINQDVNVTGTVNVNKNITSIDYGQLAIANAQREKNRLENLKYDDERDRSIYLSVAENPLMAYDFGTPYIETVRNGFGFRRLTISITIPHKSLFVPAGVLRYENVSSDGITTEIFLNPPQYSKEVINCEKMAKMELFKTNTLNLNAAKDDSIFVLKKDINRATVWGNKGFVGTLIWQDDYQNTITDNYHSYTYDGVYNFVKVRYFGDKDEVTFEQLEGRRYYLKKLVEKIISTASVYDYKY